jgi:hypothetical protein
VLLTGYQTPAAIRSAGVARLESWLRKQRVHNAAALAQTAVEAARTQSVVLPGERLAAQMVARLAKGVIALDNEIAELDELIEARFRERRHAEVITSLPGIGPRLGAEFLAATGGDMTAFTSSSPGSPAWHHNPATRDVSTETCAAPSDITAGCCAQFTCRRKSRSPLAPHRAPFISANAPKANPRVGPPTHQRPVAMLRDHTTYHDSPPISVTTAA